jgi:hypothetical protein
MSGTGCYIANGEQKAAQQVLAISQRELSRIRDQGLSVASASDRMIFSTPNFKALSWPQISGPGVTLQDDYNRKDNTAESVNAVGFTAPFLEDGSKLERPITQPSYAAPQLGFAATGNLAQVDLASFQGDTLPDPGKYAQIAAMIQTGLDKTPSTIESYSVVQRPAQGTPNMGTSLLSNNAQPLRNLYQQSKPQMTAPNLYGAAKDKTRDEPIPRNGDFLSNLSRAVKGALYDLANYNDIKDGNRVVFILTRENRTPYLGFAIASVALIIVTVLMLLRLC